MGNREAGVAFIHVSAYYSRLVENLLAVNKVNYL